MVVAKQLKAVLDAFDTRQAVFVRIQCILIRQELLTLVVSGKRQLKVRKHI